MIRSITRNIGFQPKNLFRALIGWRRYVSDRRNFRYMQGSDALTWENELPILLEWEEQAANLGAYFFQDLLAAKWIMALSPLRHFDVGSRIDGFIGHLAVYREVDVIDIRALLPDIPNVTFHQIDIMKDLQNEWLECTDSLSCLHTIEHFGLGRYGDPLDPLGHLKGLTQLKRMLKPGGMLLLSTPVGRQRIEFNAHRVFSPATIHSWFNEGWKITRSAVIDDKLEITESTDASALLAAKCLTGVAIVHAQAPLT